MTLAFIFIALHLYPATNIPVADDELSKLRPPRAELPPTFWDKYEVWVILGSILFLALIAAMVWLATRPKPPIIVPPEIRAKQALDLLKTKPETGLALSQISQILRRYVADAFSLPPGELTTTEFCQLIAGHEGIGPELSGAISEFLRRCDERKFAPSPSNAPMAAVGTALNLVDTAQTRVIELRRRTDQASAA